MITLRYCALIEFFSIPNDNDESKNIMNSLTKETTSVELGSKSKIIPLKIISSGFLLSFLHSFNTKIFFITPINGRKIVPIIMI